MDVVEVTPTAIRLRKLHLTENMRKKMGKKKNVEVAE